MTEDIKYFVLKLDNEFIPNYLVDQLNYLIKSEDWSRFDMSKQLKWRDIVDILIRSEPKQRTQGNRMELYEKYEIRKKVDDQ